MGNSTEDRKKLTNLVIFEEDPVSNIAKPEIVFDEIVGAQTLDDSVKTSTF